MVERRFLGLTEKSSLSLSFALTDLPLGDGQMGLDGALDRGLELVDECAGPVGVDGRWSNPAAIKASGSCKPAYSDMLDTVGVLGVSARPPMLPSEPFLRRRGAMPPLIFGY